jgi:hypothetical protein
MNTDVIGILFHPNNIPAVLQAIPVYTGLLIHCT